jgi:hypothetical protein
VPCRDEIVDEGEDNKEECGRGLSLGRLWGLLAFGRSRITSADVRR